jgi:hypothetical protein
VVGGQLRHQLLEGGQGEAPEVGHSTHKLLWGWPLQADLIRAGKISRLKRECTRRLELDESNIIENFTTKAFVKNF